MNRNILTAAIIVLAIFLVILVKNNPQVRRPLSNPLVVEFNEVNDFAKLRPGHIKRATKYVLELSNQILAEILAVPDNERTFKNTLERTDDIYAVIESVWSPGYLMASTHTNEKIRDEGLESSRTIQKYLTDLSLNEDLYNAVIAYSRSKDAHQLTGYKQKFLDDTLLDYKRSGFGLPKERREKVKEILIKQGFENFYFRKDFSKIDRVLVLKK